MNDDEAEIRRLIGRFANAFDLKAWDALEACLTESLATDYSDLRGTPPEVMARRCFVEMRRAALERLQTHHLSGNYEITVDGGRGRDSEGRVLDTHCLYDFDVARSAVGWRIASITQKVLWSDGDWAIHSGIQKA